MYLMGYRQIDYDISSQAPEEITQNLNWPAFLDRPIQAPLPELGQLVCGKKVLITGAGGSIGSSLAHALMTHSPAYLLLLDNSEQNLCHLYRRFVSQSLPLARIEFLLGNVLDQEFLNCCPAARSPEIIFHTAASKHLVPLESAPFEAFENNVLGTLNVLRMAEKCGSARLINVSTDKAVSPTSVLGVSKRITELLLSTKSSQPLICTSLRMGNVLGSSGSIVPIVLRSLESGVPIILTDPMASRYFLSMPEAASALLAALPEKSSLLLPSMGLPKKLIDLISFIWNELHGRCEALSLCVVGLRDGEKRTEQLLFDHEYSVGPATHYLHRLISTASIDPEKFFRTFSLLCEHIAQRRSYGLLNILMELVPEFTPSATFLRSIG
jgi:FlaA1/EpsC-like NDP-sugar epimerase